jgi:large subunit ribosomal protein L23
MAHVNTGMNEEKLLQVIRAPHVSEKGSRLADKHKQFVFEVRRDATKPQIKAAVEKVFGAQVASVTVSNAKGKLKRTGRQQDWKKAYVSLKPGQDIDFTGAQ